MIPFIDLATQQRRLDSQIRTAIDSVLAHGKYIMGPEVAELESQLAGFVGVKHCISVSSGTDSLLIAMMALDIGPGDEVITVPYTWISTAEMIALLGATPVFVDVDAKTWNMDPSLLEQAITERTKAIMPVGIYGQTADMSAIAEIAGRHDLPVIEDAAQCFGASHGGKQSCGLSRIGSTSFFPTKPLGCYGDGGALFTDDDELAERMRIIRVHGQSQKHHHREIGLNGRLDTIQAAILLAKFSIFPEECVRRRDVADLYSSHLSRCESLQTPFVSEGNECVFAQYTIIADDRDGIQEYLKRHEIPSVAYYVNPLHLQPAFAYLGHSTGDFPVTERISQNCLSLPMSPWLEETTIAAICEHVNKASQSRVQSPST